MTAYVDTSLLIAAVAREPESERVQEWLAASGRALSVSDWTITEFSSALALKLRMGAMSAEKRAEAARWFRDIVSESATVLQVTRPSFRRAADLAAMTGVKIRAPDALHLAVAERNGLTLYTLDRDQAEAGLAAGIPAELL